MKKFVMISGFLCLFAINSAFAQTAAPATTMAPLLNFTQTNTDLDKMTAKLNSGKVSSKETNDYFDTLTQIQNSVSQSKLSYSSELDSLQKKINALGPAPENGAKEPQTIAKQRREFNTQADNLKAQIAQADLVKTKIEELNSLILKIRNQELLNNIMVKQSSIFHPREFWHSLTSFAGFVFEMMKSPASWYNNLTPAQQTTVKSKILIVLLSMLIAFIIAIYLSRYIKKWFGYKRNIDHPNYSQKVQAGIWMLIARGAIPAAIIGAFLLWLKNNTIVNTDSFGLLLKTIAIYFLYYYLCKAIIKVVFTPFNSKWRIIEVSDDRAQAVSAALIFATAAICIVSFFQSLADQMDYNTDIIYSLKIFANAVKAFCIILVAKKALYDNSSLTDDELQKDEDITDLSPASKASLFITFLMTAAFALSLFGYIRLSEFIINRFIISIVVTGIFYIINKLLRVFFHQLLLPKFWIRTFRINRRTLVKSEFWFGLILTPVMWIFCILTLLAVWGVSVDILISNVKNFLVGFNIGGMHISITSILLGIICFFIALSLFKMLKNSFLTGNLSKIEMDDGVRNSVVSAIGFLGFIFSGILAIAVMGGSFSSIAIIAGALSFGAGLGLQNMVSNLVAGMTILFERPLKVGDWVIINDQEGIVKQINMRSTELETWSKANVIIPNADILSKSLINLTYSNRTGRVTIKVGVDYDSDIDLLKQTLLEIAQSNPKVLTLPPPSVAFNELGDSSLDFQLNAYTANVYDRAAIATDLREKIVKRFKELNINIPYPQRVIYLQPENPPTEKNTTPASTEKNISQAPAIK